MNADRRLKQRKAEKILRETEYWHYPFELPWGLTIPAKTGHDEWHRQRRQHFFEPMLQAYGGSLAGKQLLDLGCCQGFWSFEAARAGATSCLGIDSSKAFIAQARALRTVLGSDTCEFRRTHLEDDAWWDGIGSFDVTLFLGLFYHLTDPVFVLRRAMALTRETIVVDTEAWTPGWPPGSPEPPPDIPTLILVSRDQAEPTTTASGIASRLRAVPTPAALVALLRDGGFARIDVLPAKEPMPPGYLSGGRISVIARR